MLLGSRFFVYLSFLISLSLNFGICSEWMPTVLHSSRNLNSIKTLSGLPSDRVLSLNLCCNQTTSGKHSATDEQPHCPELSQSNKTPISWGAIEGRGRKFYGFRPTGCNAQTEVGGAGSPLTVITASLSKRNTQSVEWLTDYHQARAEALRVKKDLLIHFSVATDDWRQRRFITETAAQPDVNRLLSEFVCVRLPMHYTITVDDQQQVLLRLPDFEILQRHGGLAVVDLSDPVSTTHGQVTAGLPFIKPNYYVTAFESPSSVRTLLGLPPGTLAERMMIYAIRMHPEAPRSTTGVLSPILRKAASDHSHRQARLERQGHQQWQSRFEQIWAQIGGKPPVEICAESWPDEPLLTACLGCVDAWRQSAGHWKSVAGSHPLYAFSIHRGRNRIWYATGIFGG